LAKKKNNATEKNLCQILLKILKIFEIFLPLQFSAPLTWRYVNFSF